MKPLPPSPKRRGRIRTIQRIFAVLSVLYLIALGGTAYVVFAYGKYLGEASPVQQWMDRNNTSYSQDIYDTVLQLQKVDRAYYYVQANKSEPIETLLDQVEYLRGVLGAFDPSAIAGQLLNKLPSYNAALHAANDYANQVEHWAKAGRDRIGSPAVVAAHKRTAELLRKLSIEASQQEFASRDAMMEAVNSSRNLASMAGKIGIVIYGFGAIALFMVYRIGRAWVLAERERVYSLEQERKRLEERVAERTKSLNAALEAQRLFIANASHELRTPVNTLRLLLGASEMSGDKREDIVPSINDLANHMSQLVENLLLLDSGRQATTKGAIVDFDLGDEIRATCNMLGPYRQNSNAAFSVNVESCMGTSVKGDLTALRSILINLLSNAFKYTDEGSVRLTATADIDVKNSQVRCSIRVKDTGAGISADLQERIFDPFVTGGAQRGHTGTGLGLSLSRELAKYLGGSLRLLSSMPGDGSEFECITVFECSSKSLAFGCGEGATAAVFKRKRLKVLLAEDDPLTADVVQKIIRLLHHDVVHVGTYDALIEHLVKRETGYDVILTDHRLPGGNGLDAITMCRAENLARDSRLVLMTADVTREVLEKAKSVCDELITKPTTAQHIRKLLGEGVMNEVEEQTFINPAPITTLRNSGVATPHLVELREMFFGTVVDALDNVRALSQAPDGLQSVFAKLDFLIHRVRSACATIGAVGLGQEFQALLHCKEQDSFEQQIHRIGNTFDETRIALSALFVELDRTGSS